MTRLSDWWTRRHLDPCPNCGAHRFSEILYGLVAGPPTKRMQRRFALGGCIIEEGQPTHECKACGHRSVEAVRTRYGREPFESRDDW